MQYNNLSIFTTIIILLISKSIRGVDWINYDLSSSNLDTIYDDDNDDSNQYISALTRDDEQEIHSPVITGYKYVSGGAGEGQQHLSPSGEISNRPEVKTDEELKSYCHPPNPCPIGFESDDCDSSPMILFTADYSRLYQSEQKCQCDTDHDKCSTKNIFNVDKSNDSLKRSRRVGRDVHSTEQTKNTSKDRNLFHKGQTLRFHVAKKSPNSITI
ncbi:unnamed protein product [Adineta steineri]|uniref:Neuroendocrine protein 7B2 n=1 Tax=Adineta steineri TaxID=433720 RepID=A0A814ZET3_9BILA|nr:unnamed protein product [Adineta steineri]CAF1244325.1 unnamed protein product [Adineta steineri]